MIATARVTVRANINRLVGGAGEDTILARVGEGIVSTIGSADSHKAVLENPDKISKTVLAKGLDAGTAFEILSIDIADVDVGKNIGAELQTDQAEADKRIAQAKAEERRAMAVAVEQENRAKVQEMRAASSRPRRRCRWPWRRRSAAATSGSWTTSGSATSTRTRRCGSPSPASPTTSGARRADLDFGILILIIFILAPLLEKLLMPPGQRRQAPGHRPARPAPTGEQPIPDESAEAGVLPDDLWEIPPKGGLTGEPRRHGPAARRRRRARRQHRHRARRLDGGVLGAWRG
jgi:hypothetical protein